jgi:hypothetical protein
LEKSVSNPRLNRADFASSNFSKSDAAQFCRVNASRPSVAENWSLSSVSPVPPDLVRNYGSYKFTFFSELGEVSGRVTVGTEGPPDRRSQADQEQSAKNQILALSRELGEACEDR